MCKPPDQLVSLISSRPRHRPKYHSFALPGIRFELPVEGDELAGLAGLGHNVLFDKLHLVLSSIAEWVVPKVDQKFQNKREAVPGVFGIQVCGPPTIALYRSE